MFLLKTIRQLGILQLLSVLMVVALSLSCSSKRGLVMNCIPGMDTPSKFVRWGTIEGKNISGFEMDEEGIIQEYDQTIPIMNRTYNGTKIKSSVKVFTRMRTKTYETFLKVQTLNAPGKLSHFIEYDNGSGTILRAIWNPEFATKGSAEFREIYQELQTIIADK